MKRTGLYIALFAILVVILSLIEAARPAPVNWSPDFTRGEKAPYGAWILYRLLPELAPGAQVRVNELTPFDLLGDSTVSGTYIFLNEEFDPSEDEVERLRDFVERGNTVFVAARTFGDNFTGALDLFVEGDPFGWEDTATVQLVNPRLKKQGGYRFKRWQAEGHIVSPDTANTTILGMNSRGEVNYVRVTHGSGSFLVSTVPYAFTNYSLTEPESGEYALRALSYIPRGAIIWDEHYKAGRNAGGSPMRWVWSQAPFTWALALAGVTLLLFVIFMGRRRQRIVPEITPLPNTTLEFTRTVARLYYARRNHRNIAGKMITYFLEHLRARYHVNANDRGEDSVRILAARSGVDHDAIRSLFRYIDGILAASSIGEEELTALNKAIERFQFNART